MSEQLSDRSGLPNLVDRVKQLVPGEVQGAMPRSCPWCAYRV